MTAEKVAQLRHEFKYEISPIEYLILQKKLLRTLKPDPYMPKGCPYNVRNLYFDDQNNTALVDKEAGEFKRKKYRIRIYNHSGSYIKFERKNRIGPYMLKENTRITRQEADKLIQKDCTVLCKTSNPLLRDFYSEIRCSKMLPVVIVEYEREAYVHPVGNVRVTFDTHLRTAVGCTDLFDFKSCTMSTLEQRNIILEVKFTDVLPSYIRGLFPETIKPRLAIGKYVICRKQQMAQKGCS